MLVTLVSDGGGHPTCQHSMIWPFSPVLPPEIVFKFQSVPAFIFEVILEISLAFLIWTGLKRLRRAVNIRTSYRVQGSQTDLSNYRTSNVSKSDVNKNVHVSRTKQCTQLGDPAPFLMAAAGTPPIRITSATPPLSRKSYETADEDSTDWEDAEEPSREHELAGSSSSTAIPAGYMYPPCMAFRPILSLAPPPIDTSLLTSMPPAKDISSADSTCDESASLCSRASSPDISTKCGWSHIWSDVEEHPQKECAHWENSDGQPYDVTAKKRPFGSDAHYQGVSASQWQNEYGLHHQGVSAVKCPYDQYVPHQKVSAHKCHSDAYASQGVSAADLYCSAEPARYLSAEHWQRLFMHGYPQVQPQPTIPSWNSVPELSSQESFPDSATSYWNARQPQVGVLTSSTVNRIPENVEKESTSSWLPPASYPAGACGLINQLAHRNHSLKEVIVAQFANNLCVSEGDEASQDEDEEEDEDDGLDE